MASRMVRIQAIRERLPLAAPLMFVERGKSEEWRHGERRARVPIAVGSEARSGCLSWDCTTTITGLLLDVVTEDPTAREAHFVALLESLHAQITLGMKPMFPEAGRPFRPTHCRACATELYKARASEEDHAIADHDVMFHAEITIPSGQSFIVPARQHVAVDLCLACADPEIRVPIGFLRVTVVGSLVRDLQ